MAQIYAAAKGCCSGSELRLLSSSHWTQRRLGYQISMNLTVILSVKSEQQDAKPKSVQMLFCLWFVGVPEVFFIFF